MARHVVLLRGINLGARNRIGMPALREVLERAGFENVRTYLQSGNVVLSSGASSDRLARTCEQQIAAAFGLEIPVVVRTRAELSKVVQCNPLGAVAVKPKRYQVSFMTAKPEAEVLRKLEKAVVAPEQFVVVGRELYAWHPEGVARSRLWACLRGGDWE